MVRIWFAGLVHSDCIILRASVQASVLDSDSGRMKFEWMWCARHSKYEYVYVFIRMKKAIRLSSTFSSHRYLPSSLLRRILWRSRNNVANVSTLTENRLCHMYCLLMRWVVTGGRETLLIFPCTKWRCDFGRRYFGMWGLDSRIIQTVQIPS